MLSWCVLMCVCVCVCVYVCVCQREQGFGLLACCLCVCSIPRKTERNREKETARDREKVRERERQQDRNAERERERQRERDVCGQWDSFMSAHRYTLRWKRPILINLSKGKTPYPNPLNSRPGIQHIKRLITHSIVSNKIRERGKRFLPYTIL